MKAYHKVLAAGLAGVLVVLLGIPEQIVFQSTAAELTEKDLVKTQVTVQMWQDGKVDNSRLFILDFFYSGVSQFGKEYCNVISTTINNLTCSADSIGEGGGIWTMVEIANYDYSGRDLFRCQYRQINQDTAQLTVTEKGFRGGEYQRTHILKTVENSTFHLI